MEARDPSSETLLKCVLVGDHFIGKTSLVVSYTSNGYPSEYKPTAFDNYSVDVQVEEKTVRLQICDTGGHEHVESLRQLCYPDTQVFILCFSVLSPHSFRSLKEKWIPEVREQGPSNALLLLVGTQCDLRHDVSRVIELAQQGDQPVSEADAQRLANEIKAVSYFECSALTQKNLKDVFDMAIWTCLQVYERQRVAMEGREKHHKNHKHHHQGSHHHVPGKISQGRLIDEEEMRLMKKKAGWKKLLCVT